MRRYIKMNDRTSGADAERYLVVEGVNLKLWTPFLSEAALGGGGGGVEGVSTLTLKQGQHCLLAQQQQQQQQHLFVSINLHFFTVLSHSTER